MLELAHGRIQAMLYRGKRSSAMCFDVIAYVRHVSYHIQ